VRGVATVNARQVLVADPVIVMVGRRPGQIVQHTAARGGPDKPGHDEFGAARDEFGAGRDDNGTGCDDNGPAVGSFA
jgi:hypothetical protein